MKLLWLAWYANVSNVGVKMLEVYQRDDADEATERCLL